MEVISMGKGLSPGLLEPVGDLKVKQTEEHTGKRRERSELDLKSDKNRAEDDVAPSGELGQTLEELESRFAVQGVSLKFHVAQENGAVQVEVLDAESNKLVRKIPGDEAIRLAEQLKKAGGKKLLGGLLNGSL